MLEFYLIRHGETDWNSKLRRLQGHTDIPLNDKGVLQAQALKHLTAGLGIQKVISSDLQRALKTAQHMTDFQGPHETTQSLREVHLGIGEGLTWNEVDLRLGTDFRSRWSQTVEDHMDLRFPEGESRREVIARVKNYLLSSLEKNKEQKLAFVSHGYVIRALVCHLKPLKEDFFVPNCAVVPFVFQKGQLIYTGPDTTDLLLQPRIED